MTHMMISIGLHFLYVSFHLHFAIQPPPLKTKHLGKKKIQEKLNKTLFETITFFYCPFCSDKCVVCL